MCVCVSLYQWTHSSKKRWRESSNFAQKKPNEKKVPPLTKAQKLIKFPEKKEKKKPTSLNYDTAECSTTFDGRTAKNRAQLTLTSELSSVSEWVSKQASEGKCSILDETTCNYQPTQSELWKNRKCCQSRGIWRWFLEETKLEKKNTEVNFETS